MFDYMNDAENIHLPARLPRLLAETARLNFTLASDTLTGCLPRTLTATRPGGKLLELGTGTGVATAWILDGMDEQSRLVSVEIDETLIATATRFLGDDPQV